MTSIYKKALGEQFNKLHPMLQKRYTLTKANGFIGKGIMEEISGGGLLERQVFRFGVPFHVFFPERGENIPFIIENRVTDGLIEWNRSFLFKHATRHFDAVMFWDDEEKVIVDLFGKPAILGSTLSFNVTPKGSLQIGSLEQWLEVKGKRMPLPKMLYGEARIEESYDEEADVFRIQVEVKNTLLGTLFFYKGSFKEVGLNEKE